MKKHNWIIWLILMILWMGLIFYFSSRTSSELGLSNNFIVKAFANMLSGFKLDSLTALEQTKFISDASFYVSKTAHYIEYNILMLFSFMTFKNLKKYNLRYIISLVICILYAISDEIHQMYSSGRTPRFLDVCIDSLGAITMLLIIELVITIVKTKRLGKHD